MTSSSSSSSSEKKKGKKKEKKKKDKKKEKKAGKKAAKEDKKSDKRAKAAEEWLCDRAEAVRLVGQLLDLDAGIAEELAGLFGSIDAGDVVRIDGLQDKQAKKKLRHLLQAFKLSPVEGQGFRTADRKVSFLALFESCLAKARRPPAGPAAAAAAAPEASLQARTPPTAAAAPAESAGGGAGDSEGEDEAGKEPSPAAAAPAASRRVGPQLPGASVGVEVAHGGASSDEEDGDQGEDKAAGPRVEGAERRGVDLDSIPEARQREAWMTTPHASIAGAFFGEGGPRRADKYEVSRSKEDKEAFEKMYQARGPSLLQEQREGKFTGHEEEIEGARKRKTSVADMWGMTEKEQVLGAAASSAGAKAPRRAFDPEQDLQVRKPITGADFSKLIDNSVSGLAGRFGRGQVATSFL